MVPEQEPAISENAKKILKIDEKDYGVEILDTNGEEEYPNMIDSWIAFGDGFLLVFAINDRESFEKSKYHYEKIKKGKHGNECPILLVGNKKDLENEREVIETEAINLAEEWGIEYIETSVNKNDNCKKAFEMLARKISQKKNFELDEIDKSGSCCCEII